ncbi:MAG TPA: hypothetical protein VHG32_24025, partial [Thermoanaerobaculia bacterium]|nr:hypothetical protein [Thermoanaerobaculia bacterium]
MVGGIWGGAGELAAFGAAGAFGAAAAFGAADGLAATGGGAAAGVFTVGAVGSVGVGSLLRAPALESKLSGQLGMVWAGDGSSPSTGRATSADGGQAGIAGSVGGSGGQMSVSSGGAGADSDAGGHVDLRASDALDLGGSVRVTTSTGGSESAGLAAGGSAAGASKAGASKAGGSKAGGSDTCASAAGGSKADASKGGGSDGRGRDASGSAASGSAACGAAVFGSATLTSADGGSEIGSPGSVGTVRAHSGVVFLSTSPFTGDWVCDQSGSPFCMGSAGRASSSAVSTVSPVFSGGVTGTVCAQTGVVSRVGTAARGSAGAGAGGVESFTTNES